jgi:hypothetical protein
MRSEVEVLSWGPDRGNPTWMRQGRGRELTGRSAGGLLCCGSRHPAELSRRGLRDSYLWAEETSLYVTRSTTACSATVDARI